MATNGRDVILGNIFLRDVIDGRGGNDDIFGFGGDDVLFGRSGRDLLDGGFGNDDLSGGTGRDTLLGGDGRDTLDGGSNRDTLEGGSGNDLLDGGTGNDKLFGGFGNDGIAGGRGTDTVNGGAGDDNLFGGPDAERDFFVFGDFSGDDVIHDFTVNGATPDVISFSGRFLGGIDNFDQLLSQSAVAGENVFINLGLGDSLTLVGVNIDDLDASQFLF